MIVRIKFTLLYRREDDQQTDWWKFCRQVERLLSIQSVSCRSCNTLSWWLYL